MHTLGLRIAVDTANELLIIFNRPILSLERYEYGCWWVKRGNKPTTFTKIFAQERLRPTRPTVDISRTQEPSRVAATNCEVTSGRWGIGTSPWSLRHPMP